MPVPQYSPQETARRGKEWYERSVRAQVEEGNFGKVLVIDVETGEYELGDGHLTVARRAFSKKPEAQLYALRIGFPALSKRARSSLMGLLLEHLMTLPVRDGATVTIRALP